MIITKMVEFINGIINGILIIPIRVIQDILDLLLGTFDTTPEDTGVSIGIIIFLGFLFWL